MTVPIREAEQTWGSVPQPKSQPEAPPCTEQRMWITGLRAVWAKPNVGVSLEPSLVALGGCFCAEQSRRLDEFFSVLGFGHFVPFGRESGQKLNL